MVGSRVSASRTMTSSSEGPLYLSSSARATARRSKVMRRTALLIFLKKLYVLIIV